MDLSTDPTDPTNSGAIAVNVRKRIVGMHCWGSDQAGVYNKIRNIIEQLGVDPIVGDALPASAVALAPKAPRPPVRSRAAAIDTLARTLWGEARSEGTEGMEAVACVIVNRAVRRRASWGTSVEDVCCMPKQFSCWNPGDRNLPKLTTVTAADDTQFEECLEIAARAVDGSLGDFTGGATHYHVRGTSPSWVKNVTPCFELGHHLFYNNVP